MVDIFCKHLWKKNEQMHQQIFSLMDVSPSEVSWMTVNDDLVKEKKIQNMLLLNKVFFIQPV
jgi:hypothetical protein